MKGKYTLGENEKIELKKIFSSNIDIIEREVQGKEGALGLERDIEKLINTSFYNTNYMKRVPSHLFFIWLGRLEDSKLIYPKVWKKTGVKPIIYYDANAFLAGLYKSELLSISKIEHADIIEIQNSLYDFFIINEYRSFDSAFIDFVRLKSGEKCAAEYENKLSTYKSFTDLSFEYIDINSFENLFYKSELRRFYFYEVMLRNNLAAACDILRLLILYLLGGVYVDFDTLPDFSYIFKKTDFIIEQCSVNRNLVDIVRAEKVISKIDGEYSRNYTSREQDYLSFCVRHINHENENILKQIDSDIVEWNGSLDEFDFPFAYLHTGKISASKNCLAEYNNNILAAHAKSKGIRILFRVMTRRYRYLEKHGYVFGFDSLNRDAFYKSDYLERLKPYRLDGTSKSKNVTLILSGPSLLLEVILGLSYSLLSIDSGVSPLVISYALRDKYIGIGFDNQTMFTLEHMQSSWM